MLIPSSANSGSPSKTVPEPNFSCSNHRASFALTMNQPSPLGTRPASVCSSGASGTISLPPLAEQPFEGERSDRGCGREREQVDRSRNPLELRAGVAQLDVADRIDVHTAASAPARAFVALAGARSATSAKPKTCL